MACRRFSAPAKRSNSPRFSRCMVLAPHAPSGYWALGLRVANMRKHIMIRPEVRHSVQPGDGIHTQSNVHSAGASLNSCADLLLPQCSCRVSHAPRPSWVEVLHSKRCIAIPQQDLPCACVCVLLLQVQVLLAKPDNPGQSAFECQELQLENSVSSMANLRLGMAVTIMHVIRCATGSQSACRLLVSICCCVAGRVMNMGGCSTAI
eukprot:GHRQ01027586.1.p1 GENE.GHRQ01027586.1~~GHRQ01027586.1.p1  ORF type:complete len:206 (+),score=40.25 GHRQ01027586.1:883-1500(+)